MQSILTKAKEKIANYNSGKSSPQLDERSPSYSRKRKEAALRADLFAGPDKIVSSANTYGLISLTVHEAKVPEEHRYCAVVSIGMQVSIHERSGLAFAYRRLMCTVLLPADIYV